MWFKKKQNRPKNLSAEQACELTNIQIAQKTNERRNHMLNKIYECVLEGYFNTHFNGKYSSCWITEQDISYLESLGYKVEQKENQTTYYEVSWKSCTNVS